MLLPSAAYLLCMTPFIQQNMEHTHWSWYLQATANALKIYTASTPFTMLYLLPIVLYMLICLKIFSKDLNVLTCLVKRCILITSFTHSVKYRQRNKWHILIRFHAITEVHTKHEMGNIRLQEIPSGNGSGHGTKKWYFESALELFKHGSSKKCHCTFIYRTSRKLLKPVKITETKCIFSLQTTTPPLVQKY